MRVAAATRPGRSHRRGDGVCQDAQASWTDPQQDRACVAVADGLGSKRLSHFGSQAACTAAVARLAQAPVWDEASLVAAVEAAIAAVADEAHRQAVPPDELATTLQILVVEGSKVQAAMVGDGAVVAMRDGQPHVLVAPRPTRYANEVVPITAPTWRDALQIAHADAEGPAFVFTDGLVRLLLAKTRAGWGAYEPFFAAFVPRIGDPDVVRDFVHSDAVDASWDDDKCLAVVWHGPG